MSAFETANGKEIQAVRNPQAMWIVQFATGGQLPDELTGIYTSERNAISDIQRYIDKTKERKTKTVEK